MTKTNENAPPQRAEPLLTYDAVAALWDCCARTVKRKADNGEIEVVYMGERMPRIRESVAAKYVAERIGWKPGGKS